VPELVDLSTRPRVREFAELALEFLGKVFKEEVFSSVEYVVVFDYPIDPDTVGGIVRELEKRFSAYPVLLDLLRLFVQHLGVVGPEALYVSEERMPRMVVACLPTDWMGFRRLAHEFAHHVFGLGNYAPALAIRYLADTGLLDIYERVYTWARRRKVEEVLKAIREFTTEFLRIVEEFATEYSALNYFVFLNTKPTLTPHRLLHLDFRTTFLHFFPALDHWIGKIGESLHHLETAVKLYIGRLPRARAETFAEQYLKATERATLGIDLRKPITTEEFTRFLEHPEEFGEWLDFRGFLSVIRLAYEDSLRRFPKDVFLEDPGRYSALLRGLPVRVIEVLVAGGMTVMDEARIPDVYRRAIESA
jgi:hypothetical protein